MRDRTAAQLDMTDVFFDTVYSGGADYYGLGVRPEFHQFLIEFRAPNLRCLDLACGQGRHAIPAAEAGWDVDAVDYSATAINQLKALADARHLPINAARKDIRTLAPPPGEYAAAFLVSTLSHFDEVDLLPLVDMVFDALAVGGVVFVEAFTTADPGHRGSADASETSSALKHYFEPGELAGMFGRFAISTYREFIEDDLSHGPAHKHGVALLIAQKPADQIV